jgi:hypothetical protein
MITPYFKSSDKNVSSEMPLDVEKNENAKEFLVIFTADKR